MRRRTPTTLLLAALLNLGCAATGVDPGERAPFIQSQKDYARQLQREGKPAQALAVWRTTLAAGTPDRETVKAIAALEDGIATDVAQLRSRAAQAYQGDDAMSGDRLALQLLALQPDDPQARAWLTHSRQQAVISTAVEQTTPTPPSTPANSVHPEHAASGSGEGAANAETDLPAPGEAPDTIQPAAESAPLPAGLTATASDQDASDAWYRRGRVAMNTDIDAAIEAFERALVFEPGHAAATDALKRARRLKRNLQRIEHR